MRQKQNWGRFSALLISMLLIQSCGTFMRDDMERKTEYRAETFETGDGYLLPYRLLSPLKVKAGESYPLVIFLHGAGERGDDNRAQLVHGTWVFEERSNRRAFPAWVIAPQCPAEERWADVDWSRAVPRMSEDISKSGAAVMELLESFAAEHAVDRSRIYISGLSMGGYGSWDLMIRFPEIFAAGAPVCGGGDIRYAESIAGIPQWVFHGAEDPVVPLEASSAMVEALKAAGADVRFTVYEGVGHDSWVPAYAEKELLPWLFAQRRK